MDGSNQEKALVPVAESRQMKSSEETREVCIVVIQKRKIAG